MPPKVTTITMPAVHSLAYKVCAFFIRDPFEELSTPDIQLKFSEFPGKVDEQLKDVVDAGLLNATRTRSKEHGMHLVYKAGPNLEKAWEPAGGTSASASLATDKIDGKAPTKKPGSAASTAPFKLTADLIKVHTNLPLPSKKITKTPNPWDAVFELLDQPGKAVELPEAAFRGAVLACGLRRRHAKPGVFEVRRIDAERCGIWRMNDDGSTPTNLLQAA